MPWKEITVMSLRKEFIVMARQEGVNFSDLCKRFGISRKTGYKWFERFGEEGNEGLTNQSRKPLNSPMKTSDPMEAAVLDLRWRHSAWGGRKIKQRLKVLGHEGVPAASTITEILRRHKQLDFQEGAKHTAFVRFERETPNDLWQMDFKGHVPCPEGRCHPLTVLDDCSRFSIVLRACDDEQWPTVQSCLTNAFHQYGLPRQMLMDNGSPWGSDAEHIYTPLTVWLMRLSILVSHSRVYHPQTQGKEERFHRTLKAELLGDYIPWKRPERQQHFDEWRTTYNCERPHEALNMEVPASRYQFSQRLFPERLEEVEYGPEDVVRKVQQGGHLLYRGHDYKIPKAFYGQKVALRPRAEEDGILDVFFCQQKITSICLRTYE